LLEVNSVLPLARRMRNQLVHPLTVLAALYLVGALADAPASARLDASNAADRMASATTRLLTIASSVLIVSGSRGVPPARQNVLPNPNVRKS
jgi:hypothetical protein